MKPQNRNAARNTSSSAARKPAADTAPESAEITKTSAVAPAASESAAPTVAPEMAGNGAAAAAIGAEQGKLAALGAASIGFLMSWDANKVENVSRLDARAIFAAAGVEKYLPETIEPSTALTRAQSSGKKPKGYAVRGGEGTEGVFFLYKVDPGQGESGDNFTAGARVKVDSGKVVALPPEGGAADPAAMAWGEDIANRANTLVTHVAAADVSAALTRVAAAWHAYPLRAMGGVYFAGPSLRAQWTALAVGLVKIGFKPRTIDMFSTPDNVSTAGGVAAEGIESELATLSEDIDRATSGGMMSKTLEARAQEAGEILARIELYRSVLMDAADGLAAKAEDYRKAFSEAASKAAEGKAAKSAPPVDGTIQAKWAAAGRAAFQTRTRNAAANGDRRAQKILIEWGETWTDGPTAAEIVKIRDTLTANGGDWRGLEHWRAGQSKAA